MASKETVDAYAKVLRPHRILLEPAEERILARMRSTVQREDGHRKQTLADLRNAAAQRGYVVERDPFLHLQALRQRLFSLLSHPKTFPQASRRGFESLSEFCRAIEAAEAIVMQEENEAIAELGQSNQFSHHAFEASELRYLFEYLKTEKGVRTFPAARKVLQKDFDQGNFHADVDHLDVNNKGRFPTSRARPFV
jgi:hypothetical protein